MKSFESTSSHQSEIPIKVSRFFVLRVFYGGIAGGFEQPGPRGYVPRGKNAPVGHF